MINYMEIYIHVNKLMCYSMAGKFLYYNLDSMSMITGICKDK